MRPTYPPYGKRILLDNSWFKTLTRDHVELVTDTIDHFDQSGIVTGTRRPADIIVVATGFMLTEMAARLNISGHDAKNLRRAWANNDAAAVGGTRVAIDVRPDVLDDDVRKVDAEHEAMIWTHPGMSTCYRNASGRVFSAMPWRFVDCWRMTHDPDMRQ